MIARVCGVALFTLFSFFVITLPVRALECGDEVPKDQSELANYIKSCGDKIAATKGQQATLSSVIKYLNNQISLAQAQIVSTESELATLELEISDLTTKISSINYSLSDLTKLFVGRVKATYISRAENGPFSAFFSNTGVGALVSRLEYLSQARDNDQKIMIALEKTRLDFDAQKNLKKTKQDAVIATQAKLALQKNNLDKQIAEKNQLLATTKNDEARYQKLLSTAHAELEAIQGIIAGRGSETKVGNVSEGDKVASIISGESPCSTGTHLHFEVVKGGSRQNPLDQLRSIGLLWDNSDAEQNGRGSWRWPLSDTIRVTQGYGQTSYSSRYAGNFHTGVDMVNKDNLAVMAVKPGELYQGGMKCGSGTLRYVHIKQSDGFDTFYLHVNYF